MSHDLSIYAVFNEASLIEKHDYKTLQNYEKITTEYSGLTPPMGILSGIVRIVIGLKQTLVWGIYDGIVAKRTIDPTGAMKERAWVHFKHGLGNIAAGFFDMIPVIAYIILLIRCYCINEQTGAIMRYPNPDTSTIPSRTS